MDARAATLWGIEEPWTVETVELDRPRAHEVLVSMVASGLCHTDLHLITGDLPAPLPVVGGHEGAGVVEEVGPEVTGVKVGDHVVMSFIPSCGRCPSCVTGHQNLCDDGQQIMGGVALSDGTHRMRARGNGIGTMCLLGTFSEHTVVHERSVIVIDQDLPLDKACLVGCGVTTGFGAAVYSAEVRPGETVVVMGAGGIGVNAVQGARIAGAEHIVAIDPIEFKRHQAKIFGATHTAKDPDEAFNIVSGLTQGRMADAAVLSTDSAQGELIASLMMLLGKNGRAAIVSMSRMDQFDVRLSLLDLVSYQKQLRGTLFGAANPRQAIPRLLSLYRQGILKLDELITATYTLDDINTGYDDMRKGCNVRGVILF